MQSEASYAPLVINRRVRGRALHRVAWAVVALAVAGLAAVLALRGATPPPPYRTTPVERRTIVQEVEVTGQLDVARRVEVPAPLPARIESILVREGDRVVEGQVLARLDARALVIAARGASAGLEASSSKVAEARAELDAATENLERTRRLRSKDLASESNLAEAQARAARAAASLASAQADRALSREVLRSARLSESLSLMTAPMAGIVLKAPEVIGAAVSPEREPLFVIGSALDSLQLVAEVAESEVSELRPGQAAQFSVPAFPGQRFPARVAHVGVDARRSAVAVRYRVSLEIDKPAVLLLPGMTATAAIAVARAENVLAARDAVFRFNPDGTAGETGRTRVFRFRQNRLEPVRISAGLSDGAFTELRPERPGELPVGTELVVGANSSEAQKGSGPGIRLGNR